MELVYLWIEDFRNIQKQGFNFNPELVFTTIPSSENIKNEIKYTIKIDYNNDYVNLFDGNIINVTGVIGKNGSGKSSLLHCLKMMCGKLSTLTSPLIFSLLDREAKTIKTYYYKEGGVEEMSSLSVELEVAKEVKERYKIAKPKPYTVLRMQFDNSSGIKGLDFEFEDIACCFFSNAFDSHPEQIYSKIYNVSTNNRVEDFLRKYIEKIEKEAKKNKKNDLPKLVLYPSHIAEYHKTEKRTLLEFISYANTRKTGKLPDLPSSLIVQFNFDDYEHLKSENSLLYSKETINEIQKLAVQLISKSKDKRNNFLNITVLCSFYYALRWDLFQPNRVSMDRVKRGINELLNNPNALFDNIRKLLSPLIITDGSNQNAKTINEFLGKRFSDAVRKMEFSDTEMVSDDKTHYRLKADINLWTVLNLIHELKYVMDSTFIDYSWGSGISTGEEAFLSHFARLNDLKGDLYHKTIWLLVDEGDLYFHPQWQKEYFNNLLTYVKFIFPRNKVQIIISTHSPFIASDLPKQNLIFLKKNEKGGCEVANREMKKETFGNNIHELYADSFFLTDALIGDFAKTKINDIITMLQDKKALKNPNSIRQLINIIGEPIIKTKLLEMLAEKLGENVELTRLKSQQEYIAQRLKEIEKE
ncbi:MAG: AAA family ATPase [Bacteroidia bacterium]